MGKRKKAGLPGSVIDSMIGGTNPRTIQPAKQTTGKLSHADRGHVKATYYIPPDILKGLKIVAAHTGRELSDLVSEGLDDLIKKHSHINR